MSWSGTGRMWRAREDELSVFEPGNSMLCGIELVAVIDEQIPGGEFFQVNNQRPRGAVQVAFEVEERATQRVDELAGKSGRQALGKRCTGNVHQASQPPHELWRTSLEPRLMAIGAVLVVATGNGIEGLSMDLHAKALFVMLPEAKSVRHVARFLAAAGVQRGTACAAKLSSTSCSRSSSRGLLRWQKRCTSFHRTRRRQAPASCREGHRRASPVNTANPTSCSWSRGKTRSSPTTRAKTLVKKPRWSEP